MPASTSTPGTAIASEHAAPKPAAPATHRGPEFVDTISLFAIGLTSGAALAGVLALRGPMSGDILVIQSLTLVGLAAILVGAARGGRDTTYPVTALLIALCLGPLGPLGAAVLAALDRRGAAPSQRLEAWYRRIALSTDIDAEERLCDSVASGRTLDLGAAPPASFPASMATGAVGTRQAILGRIARHPDIAYLPTLRLALASPEPIVRVQAAAVAAHIGPGIRRRTAARLADLSEATLSPWEALDRLDEVEALAASGLLDERQRAEALVEVQRLSDVVLADFGAWNAPNRPDPDPARAIERDISLERLLLSRRRFSDLRRLRRRRAIRARHPTARFQPLRTGLRHGMGHGMGHGTGSVPGAHR